MNMTNKHLTLDECKIKASILLKELKSTDSEIFLQAAKRVARLPVFKDYDVNEIKANVKRKHALAVIAMEQGYDSWVALKNDLFTPPLDESFVSNYKGGFLNKWFANYELAKAEQRASGGFLLPYKKQFFICEAAYIRALGMNPDDPDWIEIDRDWVKPGNKKAFERLNKKWDVIKNKQQKE